MSHYTFQKIGFFGYTRPVDALASPMTEILDDYPMCAKLAYKSSKMNTSCLLKRKETKEFKEPSWAELHALAKKMMAASQRAEMLTDNWAMAIFWDEESEHPIVYLDANTCEMRRIGEDAKAYKLDESGEFVLLT
jgi:hypothetical protein